jgi:hypothetical protein
LPRRRSRVERTIRSFYPRARFSPLSLRLATQGQGGPYVGRPERDPKTKPRAASPSSRQREVQQENNRSTAADRRCGRRAPEREIRASARAASGARIRENAIRTHAMVRARPQRRRAVSLLFAAALASTVFAPPRAHAADEASDLPAISVESGRVQVRRSQIAEPRTSMSFQSMGPALSAPVQPGRRTIVESNLLGQDYEWGGFKPRLRLGYGVGDGASPTTGYSDVFIRGVLIKEFD